MLFARWIIRCAVITTAALALTGCPSITRQGELPPSVDRAAALAHQGDQAGAAKVYEALAEQNSGTDRNEFLFRASRMKPRRHLGPSGCRWLPGSDLSARPAHPGFHRIQTRRR